MRLKRLLVTARGQAEAEYKEDLVPEIDDSATENE